MTARILVVDDVRANLKLLETRLSIEYFEVLTATNGPDAIALRKRGGCDLVLLDVMMPGMDGFEVCRRLRAASETAHLPIILVTALDRPADRVRGLEAGADDFLTKPVDEIALIARVRSLAQLKFSIDELRSRAAHSAATRVVESVEALKPEAPERGRVLLVDSQRSSFERLVKALTYSSIPLTWLAPLPVIPSKHGAINLFRVSLALRKAMARRGVTRYSVTKAIGFSLLALLIASLAQGESIGAIFYIWLEKSQLDAASIARVSAFDLSQSCRAFHQQPGDPQQSECRERFLRQQVPL